MGEILCLACDKTLQLPQFIDTDNYDGQLVCSKCEALLYVKIVKGKVRKYKIVERTRPTEKEIKIVVRSEEEAEKMKELIEGIAERTKKLD